LEEVWKSTNQKHPTAISSCVPAKFLREELVKILKGSNVFLEVLKEHVWSYVEANEMVTAHGSKSKQIDSSSDDKSAVVEEKHDRNNKRWQRRKRKKKRRKHQQQQLHY
jgi:hypothetical protein